MWQQHDEGAAKNDAGTNHFLARKSGGEMGLVLCDLDQLCAGLSRQAMTHGQSHLCPRPLAQKQPAREHCKRNKHLVEHLEERFRGER